MNETDKKTIKQKTLLFLNNLRFHIAFQRKGKFFQLIVGERYKGIVCFLKLIFTIVGLFSAFIIFQSVYIAFLFGLGIFVISQFLEKILFSYVSLYVHLFPDFEYDSRKWLGAFFGYAEDQKSLSQIPMVGWMFSDEEFAKNIHSLIDDWSYHRQNDENKNVKMSVIMDKDDEGDGYIFFCYPNVERETANEFYEKIENERKKVSLTDVHNKLFLGLVLGKAFKILKSSYLPTFQERYNAGIPFLFRITVADENMQPKQIEGLKDFIFHDLKIKERKELDRKDIEYDLLRMLG